MESRGTVLGHHSLRLPPKSRKTMRPQLTESLQLSSPHTDKVKRSMSPRYAELQRSVVRAKVTSPKSLRMSPVSPGKRRSFVSIPRSRQELITQYRHIQVFDFESVPPKRASRLSSYKLDAAELLTTSLKKHYNKFFFVWRKHAKDLRKEQIRKETVSDTPSIRVTLPPSRTRMLTPEVEMKGLSGTESKMSEKAYSLWSERLVIDPPPKRSSQPSPFYRDAYDWSKPTPKLPTSEASIQVSQPADIDRYSQPEEQSPHSGELRSETDAGSVITRFIFTIAMVLQQRKREGFDRIRGSLRRHFPMSMPSFYQAKPSIHRVYVDSVPALVSAIQSVALRPHWIQFRTVALRLMIAPLIAAGVSRLTSVLHSELSLSFQQLQCLPRPVGRRPILSLSTALNNLLVSRYQSGLHALRRLYAAQQRRESDRRMKLRYCFQICDLARVRILARHFNRLRHYQLMWLSTPRAGLKGSVVVLGLKVVAQIVEQAKTRGIKESIYMVGRFGAELAKEKVRQSATTALCASLAPALSRQWGELFTSYRQAKQTALIVHKGKRIIARMIRRYLRRSKSQLTNGFGAWKAALLIRSNAPLSLSCPEIPLISNILQRLLTRRCGLGLTALKANYFGIDLSPPVAKEALAGALAVKGAVSRLVRQTWKKCWGCMKRPSVSLTIEKKTAGRLIYAWMESLVRGQLQLAMQRIARPHAVRAGLSLLSTLQATRSLLHWKRWTTASKRVRRGVELLAVSWNKQVRAYWRELRTGEELWEGESQRYSREQQLALLLAVRKLQTNHAVVETAALSYWRNFPYHVESTAAARHSLSISASLGVLRALRPSIAAQQVSAFQSLSLAS